MSPRIYADSGIFIAHLNGNEPYSPECGDILRAAQAGEVELHTSYVSITEVLKRRTESLRLGPEDETLISDFMDEEFIRRFTNGRLRLPEIRFPEFLRAPQLPLQ